MASPLKHRQQRLRGPGLEGYALDFHTISSHCIGYDEFGRPEFDTLRPLLGDALYKLKYGGDPSPLDSIVATVMVFLQARKWRIHLILPMPSSNPRRKSQPVVQIARRLGQNMGVPVCNRCIQKVKSTPELKNVHDPKQRAQLLAGAFQADVSRTSGKKLLLIDDLYRSGATAVEVARTLLDNGTAEAVCFVAVTRTRKHV